MGHNSGRVTPHSETMLSGYFAGYALQRLNPVCPMSAETR
jgi:hypothetical protein